MIILWNETYLEKIQIFKLNFIFNYNCLSTYTKFENKTFKTIQFILDKNQFTGWNKKLFQCFILILFIDIFLKLYPYTQATLSIIGESF